MELYAMSNSSTSPATRILQQVATIHKSFTFFVYFVEKLFPQIYFRLNVSLKM